MRNEKGPRKGPLPFCQGSRGVWRECGDAPCPLQGGGKGRILPPCAPHGSADGAEDLENRILRIQDGFNEKNKLASNQFEFLYGHPGPPSGMPAEIERRV